MAQAQTRVFCVRNCTRTTRFAATLLVVFTGAILTGRGLKTVFLDTAADHQNPPLAIPTLISSDAKSPIHDKNEVSHIAFLKIHKAASSTVQNILLRFGWKRNLTFVLPRKTKGYLHIISLHGSVTEKNIEPAPPGRHYDILCNHVYYSRDNFTKVMPNDTVYIAVVREPFEHFKSVLNYFKPVFIYKWIKGPDPVGQFLRNPTKYEKKGRVSNSMTNNRMAQEFGFPTELFNKYDKNGVQNYLVKLDREFQLVIVAEMFDESCVLMRRLLHWQTRDILYISMNVGKKNTSILPTYAETHLYKQYAKLDYDIYKHFYLRLREQIRSEGSDFDEELLQFKELLKKIKDHCILGEETLNIPSTPWGNAFIVDKNMCKDMQRGEPKFVNLIRERQYGNG